MPGGDLGRGQQEYPTKGPSDSELAITHTRRIVLLSVHAKHLWRGQQIDRLAGRLLRGAHTVNGMIERADVPQGGDGDGSAPDGRVDALTALRAKRCDAEIQAGRAYGLLLREPLDIPGACVIVDLVLSAVGAARGPDLTNENVTCKMRGNKAMR